MNWDKIEVKWAEMTMRVGGSLCSKGQVAASSKDIDTRPTEATGRSEPAFEPKPVIAE